MTFKFAFATLVVAFCATFSHATTITFSGLPGPNGIPVPNPYLEGGFKVIPLDLWVQGYNYANPIPSIYSDALNATAEIVAVSGGPFTFSRVDLADAGSGGVTYDLKGFLGASSVFSTSGGPVPGNFVTISSPSSAIIDRLDITMHKNGVSYNIDNIVVNLVPEPTTATMLCLGLLSCFCRRQR